MYISFFLIFILVQLTCNDINGSRSQRLVEVFSQTVPRNTLEKHVKFTKGDGCLFGTQQPVSYDRVCLHSTQIDSNFHFLGSR